MSTTLSFPPSNLSKGLILGGVMLLTTNIVIGMFLIRNLFRPAQLSPQMSNPQKTVLQQAIETINTTSLSN